MRFNIANQGLIHRRWNDRLHSIPFHFIPFHSITFSNPFQFHTCKRRQNRRAHESFEFLGYIQYSIFSIQYSVFSIQYSVFISIVLLRFPDIYLICLWSYNVLPFTVVLLFILYYNIDSLFVINWCSFSFSLSFSLSLSFFRSLMFLWTYLARRTNFPLRTEKAIWEGVA
jgi:hypothetical protein